VADFMQRSGTNVATTEPQPARLALPAWGHALLAVVVLAVFAILHFGDAAGESRTSGKGWPAVWSRTIWVRSAVSADGFYRKAQVDRRAMVFNLSCAVVAWLAAALSAEALERRRFGLSGLLVVTVLVAILLAQIHEAPRFSVPVEPDTSSGPTTPGTVS
jgi:hypothetical protein